MNWIHTFTGKKFYPLDPDPTTIDIEDIAHALSNLCRYGGHVRRFYSVAQHSCLVGGAVPERHRAWGLMHDATEAYLIDLPRPIKNELPDYKLAEKRLSYAIALRFNLPSLVEPKEVKEVDTRILRNEAEALLPGGDSVWWRAIEPLPDVHIGEPWRPAVAKREFLRLFASWVA